MDSNLDIATPRGQLTLADESRVAAFVESVQGYRYATTDKRTAAPVDALLINASQTIVGVVETKCRYDVTEAEFDQRYRSEWLVTWDKILSGLSIAQQVRVPFFGFLFLVKSNRLLTFRIANSAGLYVPAMRICQTETQATVNGGTAVRNNAFINMRDAKRYTLPAPGSVHPIQSAEKC